MPPPSPELLLADAYHLCPAGWVCVIPSRSLVLPGRVQQNGLWVSEPRFAASGAQQRDFHSLVGGFGRNSKLDWLETCLLMVMPLVSLS